MINKLEYLLYSYPPISYCDSHLLWDTAANIYKKIVATQARSTWPL